MIFEGKTLAERTAVVGASEETLKAPSRSCNSWSSSVANLFPGLRAENQGGRSHCASTWSTLGTQVLIFSLLPLNLRAHHLLHLFRFGCRKEKGRGQGKPTSQKKKQGEEGQKGTSWAVCFCCPTSKRRTRWRWRWSWRSRGSWWGVSWVYTMAMFLFCVWPNPGKRRVALVCTWEWVNRLLCMWMPRIDMNLDWKKNGPRSSRRSRSTSLCATLGQCVAASFVLPKLWF